VDRFCGEAVSRARITNIVTRRNLSPMRLAYRALALTNDAVSSAETSFVAVLGPETAWPGIESRSRSDLRDGADRTILVVEMASSGVPWMKPEDLHLVPRRAIDRTR
jgi:hypothetical protein